MVGHWQPVTLSQAATRGVYFRLASQPGHQSMLFPDLHGCGYLCEHFDCWAKKSNLVFIFAHDLELCDQKNYDRETSDQKFRQIQNLNFNYSDLNLC